MDQKSNESTPQRPQGDRIMDASLVKIDLPFFIQQIKTEPAWKNGDRNAITVFKTDGMRIVLVALHQDAELARHTANGVISVQLLDGAITFSTDDQSVELSKGQAVTLHALIPHSVKAKQESVFMLTLASSQAGNK